MIRNNELPAIVFCNKKETVDAVARALHDQRVRCVALRSGPSTRTLASWPFGPTMVTCSVQAYCPGWDSMRNTVS